MTTHLLGGSATVKEFAEANSGDLGNLSRMSRRHAAVRNPAQNRATRVRGCVRMLLDTSYARASQYVQRRLHAAPHARASHPSQALRVRAILQVDARTFARDDGSMLGLQSYGTEFWCETSTTGNPWTAFATPGAGLLMIDGMGHDLQPGTRPMIANSAKSITWSRAS